MKCSPHEEAAVYRLLMLGYAMRKFNDYKFLAYAGRHHRLEKKRAARAQRHEVIQRQRAAQSACLGKMVDMGRKEGPGTSGEANSNLLSSPSLCLSRRRQQSSRSH